MEPKEDKIKNGKRVIVFAVIGFIVSTLIFVFNPGEIGLAPFVISFFGIIWLILFLIGFFIWRKARKLGVIQK